MARSAVVHHFSFYCIAWTCFCVFRLEHYFSGSTCLTKFNKIELLFILFSANLGIGSQAWKYIIVISVWPSDELAFIIETELFCLKSRKTCFIGKYACIHFFCIHVPLSNIMFTLLLGPGACMCQGGQPKATGSG